MPRTLAEIAVDAGLVSAADTVHAGRLAQQRGEPLVVVLVRDLGVDEVTLLGALRRQTRTPVADPGEVRPDSEALRVLPHDTCRRLRVLPLALSVDGAGTRVLRLAMADPTDAAAITEVEHTSGCELELTLLPLSAIEELTEHGYRGFTTGVIPRPRRPFGADLAPTTQLHERPPSEETVEVPVTVPHHVISDEADAGLRLRALVGVLVDKGVIAEADYEEAVKDLLKRRSEEP
jgi:MshEN domain